MQLEAVAPSYRALAVPGKACEHLVEIAAYIVADGNHSAVDERYPGTLAEGIQLHEQHHHLDEHPRHELHEAVV